MKRSKRNRYSAEFKAKVAMAALREAATLSELSSGKNARNELDQEARLKELHAKIGELTVERDFLSKAFGR